MGQPERARLPSGFGRGIGARLIAVMTPSHTTLSRRHFLAGGAALLALSRSGRAAGEYDLLLKGGHLIDPKNGISAVRDVALLDGKVAAVHCRGQRLGQEVGRLLASGG